MMQRLPMVCLLSALLAMLVGAGCTDTEAPATLFTGTTEPISGTTEPVEVFETLGEDDLEIVGVAPELTKSEERGLMIFRHYCAHCHGFTGQGDGQNSYGLEIPPRDLLTLELDGVRTDEELRLIISGGGTALQLSPMMPPWGHLLELRRIDDLVALIHILPELEPEEDDSVPSLDDDSGMDDFSL